MKKIGNGITTALVAVVVVLAILLVGVRLLGFDVFTVLSGSMEPDYPVGSLLYVKKINPSTIKEGQVITFLPDNQAAVITHRVTDLQIATDGTLLFYTKGDANSTPDGQPVSEQNLLGTPVFTVPYLGYVASYIHQPPGRYVALAVGALLLLLLLLPALLSDKKNAPSS